MSAAARTLSLKVIYAKGEEAAYRRFCALRWPETDGAPVCPGCGCINVYDLATRRRFKCVPVTASSASLRERSSPHGSCLFVDLLAAVCLVVDASKGLSAVQLSRDLDVQHKTAFVLMHKLREAMAAETRDAMLSGEVEVDGAAFGGHVRPANAREDRVDRRLVRHRSGKRRVVVVLRQRGGRTLTRTFVREAEAIPFARERIAPGTIVSADEVAHWDLLETCFDMRRINHSDAYSRDGVHTNQAEGYFSRLRRMIGGQHHTVVGRHLGAYAVHAAWLEDHRNHSNGALADRLIGQALAAPVSRGWKGYWQRRAA